MTVVLPPPVALVDPPGSVAALGSVVEQLAAAGYAAGLTVHLLEPAGVLVGWQGADATVAAAEVGSALALAADLHSALTTAATRLTDHLDLWRAVLARVARLREDQRARFAEAGARLAVLMGVAYESGDAAVVPAAQALVTAVAGEESDRATEHRALLSALADDAATAAAVLVTTTRPFGGSGRPGDRAAVTVQLAGRLPGWGSGALARLAAEAADELTCPGTAAELEAAVARWRPYAGLPGLADALVGRLGAAGVTGLLSVLAGRAGTASADQLAGLLAGLLGSSAGLPGDRIGQVLAAVRLDPDDRDGAVDGLAAGMGLVLAAPGAGATLAAVWGRQLLAREAAQGARAGAAGTAGALLADPVGGALTVLARSGNAAAAALLLDDPGAWTTLLSREWPGGAAALDAVVRLAATAPEAGRAARAALLALGEGLAPHSMHPVLDGTRALSRVRGSVTELVTGQPGVLLGVLDAAATGAPLDARSDAALRGLGSLVAETGSAAEVTAAVQAALRAGAAGPLAGEVAGVHVAVLEYGQRLQYALAWAHEQSRAVDAQIVWSMGVSLPVALVPGAAGELAGAVEGALADFFDANGDVEIGPDTGEVRTADDAARFAIATVGPDAAPGAAVPAGAAARLGWDRAGSALGRLVAPTESLLDRLSDLPLPELSYRPRAGG